MDIKEIEELKCVLCKDVHKSIDTQFVSIINDIRDIKKEAWKVNALALTSLVALVGFLLKEMFF